MTTTRAQFEQRLAELTDPWLTRRQVEYLAGASRSAVVKWLAADPIPAEKTRTGPRRVQLIDRDTAATWTRAKLFPEDEDLGRQPGPRLAAEVQRLSYTAGERWRWTDIARMRGVTPGAISNLGRSYADHAVNPFPPAGPDNRRDAQAVSDWFHWYDSSRPGYAKRGAAAES
ncbi:hypothetical protein SAMN05216251_12713 [Actinacidiphila alni]|uniref:Uncharacterized protein n=1 Tax=Actinacidiphila alni TaxID=380248 RepID=A0A1I2L5L9_9ACTN|nr:hypothetical protein [Actinacidiphila alni]SFF74612.1 hypothetical protein SAMN05216251_12713 [Actinacidiphila alni]